MKTLTKLLLVLSITIYSCASDQSTDGQTGPVEELEEVEENQSNVEKLKSDYKFFVSLKSQIYKNHHAGLKVQIGREIKLMEAAGPDSALFFAGRIALLKEMASTMHADSECPESDIDVLNDWFDVDGDGVRDAVIGEKCDNADMCHDGWFGDKFCTTKFYKNGMAGYIADCECLSK